MSQSGKRREVKRSQQTDSNLSSAFEGFSRSLDNHTKALNKFASDFEKTTSKMTRNFETSTGRDSGSSYERGVEDALEDIHRDLDRSGKATEKGLTTLQKTGLSIETVIRNVGSLIIGEIKTAYTTVANSYQSHLSSITAQMVMSNKEYSQLYNDASEYFRQEGLNKQFSPVDYANALEDVISSGLRGEEAKTLAYQNLVMNKVLPSLDTTSRGFVRLNKLLGTDISQGVLSIAKYAEKTFEQGLNEGSITNLLETLYQEILLQSNGDSERATSMFQNLVADYTAAVDKYGYAAAEEVLGEIKSQLSSPVMGSSAISYATGASTAESFYDYFDQKGFFGVFEDLADWAVRSGGNNSTVAALMSQEGISLSTDFYNAVKIAEAYGDSVESASEMLEGLKSSFDSEDTYKELVKGLENGWTQTADDALTKQEENLMTWSATAASSIARFDEALNTVTSTLTSLASIWLFSGAAKGGGGLLKNFSGKSAGKGSVGDLASLDGASWAQTLTGSATATTSGVLVGGGSLLAGGAMILGDGISTGIKNQHVGAGLLASITGDSSLGLTEEEKLRKASNTVDKGWVDSQIGIDWKKVGSNTLKGAALGTGIGTAVGGWALGSGTAIGAGVGALAGAVTSFLDQVAESAKYNKLAKSSKELEGSLSSLSSAQEDFESTVSINNQTLEKLNEWNSLEAQQKSELFTYLQEQYPTVLGNLSSESDLDSKYIEILKTKIERENALLGKENLDAASGVFDDLKKEQESLVKAVDGYKSQASLDFVESVLATGGENGTIWNSSDISNKLDEISKLYGISKEDLISELTSGKRGAVLKKQYDKNGNFSGYTLTGQNNDVGRGTVTAGDNIQQFYDDYSTESESQQKKAQDYIDSQISAMLEAYGSIEDIFLQYYDSKSGSLVEGFGEGATSETKISLERTMSEFENAVKDIKEIGDSYGLSGVVSNRLKNSFPDIVEVWNAFDREAPGFKVGLNHVPRDNFLANLHKDEMVLTAENAEKLRSIASHGSGLNGLLSTIESLSRATVRASSVPSESLNINPVVDAIGHQTESIVSVLNSILEVVSRATSSSGMQSTIPRSVITFEGV